MKSTKFKVGDKVVCTVCQVSPDIGEGEIGTVVGTHPQYDYIVDFEKRTRWPMDEFELAHDKEQQVLEILRTYDKIRSSKGQGTTQVDS